MVDSRINVLADIGIRKAVEAAFLDRCDVVWNEVFSEFVALVDGGPENVSGGVEG